MALLVGLGLLAGCGDDSSGSTGTVTAGGELSRSAWIAEADGICRAEAKDVAPLNRELDRLNDSGLDASGEVAEFAAILRKALPRSEQALRELRQLAAPPGDSSAIDALLEKEEEMQELLEETAGEMEEGNVAKAKLLSLRGVMARRTAQWMAHRDGLEVCGV